MTYFVTGATGFIGRHLVEELLQRDGATAMIDVLVREGSQARLDDLVADWELSHPGAGERIERVAGDLQHERLGVDPGWLDAHTGEIDHLFHLAAIYDMTAGDDVNEQMNVAGTRNAVALANVLRPGCFHHVSSIAVAGDYKGLFREDMFAEGQKLPSAYHRTKYESEALVRKDASARWRVYRPAVVVGHSETGEMDKIDGPYYFFTAIQKLRDALPQWVPLIGPELGCTNIVPVDYVARAMAHIAHQPDLDGEALWDYWERNLDPDLFKDRSFEAAVNGKTVVITGGSSGIGQAAAMKIAAAGGIPILVARGMEKLEAVKAEIEAAGGTAYVYSCDLSSTDAIGELCARLLDEHAAIDMLVNNAGRSIRRSMERTHDRFHDYERTMQLNYFGAIKLIMGLVEHMKERGCGHIVNVSSIGAQTSPPRFSAYVASKAALDAWTRCVSSEVVGRGVTFTTIHMPLVKTPMIAPTKMYDAFPTPTPDEAGDMVCEALRPGPRRSTRSSGRSGRSPMH